MAKKKIHVLSNTHWDREHRHGFQDTRIMLVDVMDKLIEIMEADPEFKFYTLDGQSIVLDDYLELRPGMRQRLGKLIADGRILAGPWYSLVDCFAVNPECIVRNLLIGDRVTREFGEPMKFGYSIFSFGQMAQLPQIYAGFGIDNIVFYKGSHPDVFKKPEFIWKAPDGSKALASRLIPFHRVNFFVYFTVPVILGGDMLIPGWHVRFDNGNKVSHLVDEHLFSQHALELEPDIRIRPEEIPAAVQKIVDSAKESYCPDVILGFDGIDFSSPLKEIPAAIKKANELMKGKVELVHSTINAYIEEFRKKVDLDSLMEYEGEMRFGPVWKVHTETMSANMPIKQRLHEAEIGIINYAEPFSVFGALAGRTYPRDILRLAWKYMLQCQAHDTVHGTGVPKITRDTYYRIDQVQEIADTTTTRALQGLVASIDTKKAKAEDIFITVFNPTPYPRTEVTNLKVDLPRQEIVKDYWFTELNGERLEHYQNVRAKVNIAAVNPENRPKSLFCDRVEVALEIRDVPPLGYKTIKVERVKGDPKEPEMPFPAPSFPYQPIGSHPGVLDNGLVRVEANCNGSVCLIDLETGYEACGINVFTDYGDSGDMWIHRAPERNEAISSMACQAKVSLLRNSGLTATLRIEVVMNLPESLTQDRKARSQTTIPTPIVTEITMNRGSKRVEFKTSFVNRCKDHKLTATFPTGLQAENSASLSPFEIRLRPIDNSTNKNGHRGDELMRSVMQGFVDISDGKQGFALMSKGLKEFETRAPEAAEVELTLLRATTQTFPIHEDVFLSYAKEESQCLGEHTFEYAVFPHAGDYQQGKVIAESALYRMPLAAAQYGKGKQGKLPMALSFLKLSNPQTILNCVKFAENDSRVVIRLNNPTGKTIRESLEFFRPIKKAWLTNMNEEPQKELKPAGNNLAIDLKAYKIVTLCLEV